MQALKEIAWTRWRDYHPADTMSFYALRLRETGLIKSSPQKLLAQGTDCRFIDQAQEGAEGIVGRGPAAGRGDPVEGIDWRSSTR